MRRTVAGSLSSVARQTDFTTAPGFAQPAAAVSQEEFSGSFHLTRAAGGHISFSDALADDEMEFQKLPLPPRRRHLEHIPVAGRTNMALAQRTRSR